MIIDRKEWTNSISFSLLLLFFLYKFLILKKIELNDDLRFEHISESFKINIEYFNLAQIRD